MSDELGRDLRDLVDGVAEVHAAGVIARARRRRRMRVGAASLAAVVSAGVIVAVSVGGSGRPRGVRTIVEPTTSVRHTSTSAPESSTTAATTTTTTVVATSSTIRVPANAAPTTLAAALPNVGGCRHVPVYSNARGGPFPPDPSAPSITWLPTSDPAVAMTKSGYATPITTITRADGTLTLARAGGGVTPVAAGDPVATTDAHRLAAWFGDLDGDGRADWIVIAGTTNNDISVYLVPGSVTTGTHDPKDVGIRLPVRFTGNFSDFGPAGDQNRDGRADLRIGRNVYSGAALSAGRPGSSLAALPAPILTLPRTLIFGETDPRGVFVGAAYPAVFRIDSANPSFVSIDDSFSRRVLRVTDARHDSLIVAAGDTYHGGYTIRAWNVGGHVIVQTGPPLTGPPTGIGGPVPPGSVTRWDLSGPCA